jgi:Putative sensor
VTEVSTLTPDSAIDRIFGPVAEARTYRHFLYELISFPFGLATFVIMLDGLAVGVGTAIILIGFVILALTLALGRVFAHIERAFAGSLIEATFTPRPAPVSKKLATRLTDQRSWFTAAYFILRFPLVVMGFAASMLLLASTVAVAAPLLYHVIPYTLGFERVNSSEEALLVSLAGCVLFLLSAHIVNGIAAVSRSMASAML